MSKIRDQWAEREEERSQAEHVRARRVCQIVSMAGVEYITVEELLRRFTPAKPLSAELIDFRRNGTDDKLINAPRVKELAGPMEGGPGLVRYESWTRTYNEYSRD
ncbi:hypothetical protein [Paenibacillus tyrfis]|uniref:hypothetical protein n=1 Tax=Paenibacillus tyrfis TaxID=1501230 RepID=UPI00209DAB2F|nr:hypothetical protein [Paenibacillus tyrfis]MCP1312126.1 hypothetical protein [Paenibacillus tyrfis]